MNKFAFPLCGLLAAVPLFGETAPSLSPGALRILRNPPPVGDHSFAEERMEIANAFHQLFSTAMADAFPDLNNGNYRPPAGNGSLTQARGATQQHWGFAAGFESVRRVKIPAAATEIEKWMLYSQGKEGFKELTVECHSYSGAPESTVEVIHGGNFVARPAGQYSIPGATGLARYAKEFQWYTTEAVNFASSDRAIHGHAGRGQYAFLYWQIGNHVVKVHSCSGSGEAPIFAVAGRVHTALLSAGFYDFPARLGQRDEPRIVALDAFDANPQFNFDKLPGDLLPSELLRSGPLRTGAAADGVSQLILRAEVNGDFPVRIRLADGRGSVQPLLDGRAVTTQDRHFTFALYTPPDFFGPGPSAARPQSLFDPSAQPKRRLRDVLENEVVQVAAVPLERTNAGQEIAAGARTIDLMLARAPVVLVHGLFSNAVQCWVETKVTGTSFAVLLEKSGFMPFLVNYEDHNGAPGSGPSSYADNRRVVWDSPDPWHDVTGDFGWLRPEEETAWLRQPKVEAVSEFQRPAELRIGGIKQALEYYREQLGIAATRADVIGHSMGGILTRVWASPNYNPDYERSENFFKGDIRRMITLNTPHHGSELPILKDVLQGATIGNLAWATWARQKLAQAALWWYLEPEPGAISDLRNDRSTGALARIGPTPIPAYAICTEGSESHSAVDVFDPHRLYFNLYAGLGMFFFHNQQLLDAFIDQRAAGWEQTGEQRRMTDFAGQPGLAWDSAGIDAYKDAFHDHLDRNVYFWAQRREGGYRDQLETTLQRNRIVPYGYFEHNWDVGESWLGDPHQTLSYFGLGGDMTAFNRVSEEPAVPYEFITILRSLVFNNDPLNDGAVRVESQTGGCASSKTFDGILHSFSPWNYEVQRKCIDLLKWEPEEFAPTGFPTAGQPLPKYLPIAGFAADRVEGDEAIAWAGMVREHALAIGVAADKARAVIINRPVNHDSTALIARGAATKGMNIKGKSANWGPQKGFIARDQRFSKIWRVYAASPQKRDSEIANYSAQTETMLAEATYPTDPENPDLKGRRFAVPRALVVEAGGASFDVLVDPNEQDSEQAIVLRPTGTNTYYDWRNAGGDFDGDAPVGSSLKRNLSGEVAQRLVPMEVLADGLSDHDPRPYLTADYDILAIGFHNSPDFHGTPEEVMNLKQGKPHGLRGYISQRQWHLVKRINNAVGATGYNGGNVAHHGPENQFPKSPYVDYPLLVFDPGDPDIEGDQEIFAIRMGPPGFRDLHLKRYFEEKIREQFNLYPNPDGNGWLWEAWRPFSMNRGYDPRDAGGLAPYVDELPQPAANTQTVSSQPAQLDVTPADDDAWIPPPASPETPLEQLTVLVHDNRAEAVAAFLHDNEGTVDPNTALVGGTTPYLLACSLGHVETVRALLAAGAAVGDADMDRQSDLGYAVKSGNPELVRVLLDAGADANSRMENDSTALMWACQKGSLKLVQTLIDAGADVNAASADGFTAIDYAVGGARDDIVALLKRYGAR